MRTIAGRAVNPIGLGCMNLSHAYGVRPAPEEGVALIQRAFDLGVDHFDTAALYGFGRNEELVGEALAPIRKQIFLASKCGMTGVDGKRVVDGRPQTLTATCEAALGRLRTDHLDLYYLHRWDMAVPLEDQVGALARLVEAGKIGAIGLCEVSARTLMKAHAIQPIAAVQTEYSLWTRNPEIAVLEACQQIGAAFVAFSPLARGFLAGSVKTTDFAERDIRIPMPRFQPPQFEVNLAALKPYEDLARQAGITPAQLALAWLLSRAPNVHVIPGTTAIAHLEENTARPAVPADILEQAGALINRATIIGARYPAAVQVEIDTEEFD
jgi:aryl-alcohol dehydrogenase-like predicted oxidoreductase